MVCIYCGGATGVTNSRSQKRTNSTWRRRTCQDCQATVTTTEKIDLGTAIAVVDETASKPFSRDKLFISIFESCKHREDAPVAASQLTDTILGLLYPLISGGALQKDAVRETTGQVLARFDPAAGVHYQAYHKN